METKIPTKAEFVQKNVSRIGMELHNLQSHARSLEFTIGRPKTPKAKHAMRIVKLLRKAELILAQVDATPFMEGEK